MTAVLDFISQSWKAGFHDATLCLAQLITDSGSQSSWEARFCWKMTGKQASIRFKNMSTSRLTLCIAQHFVVPLFLGILQPGKDAPPPSVSDFLTLKTIRA